LKKEKGGDMTQVEAATNEAVKSKSAGSSQGHLVQSPIEQILNKPVFQKNWEKVPHKQQKKGLQVSGKTL
jgi:hypothetical protein